MNFIKWSLLLGIPTPEKPKLAWKFLNSLTMKVVPSVLFILYIWEEFCKTSNLSCRGPRLGDHGLANLNDYFTRMLIYKFGKLYVQPCGSWEERFRFYFVFPYRLYFNPLWLGRSWFDQILITLLRHFHAMQRFFIAF